MSPEKQKVQSGGGKSCCLRTFVLVFAFYPMRLEALKANGVALKIAGFKGGRFLHVLLKTRQAQRTLLSFSSAHRIFNVYRATAIV